MSPLRTTACGMLLKKSLLNEVQLKNNSVLYNGFPAALRDFFQSEFFYGPSIQYIAPEVLHYIQCTSVPPCVKMSWVVLGYSKTVVWIRIFLARTDFAGS